MADCRPSDPRDWTYFFHSSASLPCILILLYSRPSPRYIYLDISKSVSHPVHTAGLNSHWIDACGVRGKYSWM
ncbi:hypothetical protein VTO73DRAFT_8164 [Trametes versicolor]